MSEIVSNISEFLNLSTKDILSQKFKNKFLPIYLQFFADIAALIVSYLIQYYIRFETNWFSQIKPDLAESYFELFILPGLIIAIYWIVIFALNGMYRNWYEKSPFDEIFTILKIVLFGSLLLGFIANSTAESSPRSLFLISFVSLSSSLIIFRTIARRIQLALRKNKVMNFRSIIIAKTNKANELARKMQLSPSWGFRPFGLIPTDNPEGNNKLPILGNLKDLESVILKHKPDSVIIGSKTNKHNLLFNIINTCKDNKVSVNIEPDLYHIFTGQTKTNNLYGIPLIEVSTELLKNWQEIFKRIFDILFSLIVIIVGLPIWLLVALFISLESKGGVFYSQPRVGKDNKVFKIYKFRSMVPNKKKEQKWTTVGDKRVTKFGKFIRKTHIDEVPQFWNCLIGDMSIVGPRPEQPKFVEEFEKEFPYYNRRHKVRPGITGWWQIKYDQYELSMEEIENRLKDDFYYIENMSLKLDLEIVVRTVWCVLKGHGQA